MDTLTINESLQEKNQRTIAAKGAKPWLTRINVQIIKDSKQVLSTVKKESPVLYWIVIVCFLLTVACIPAYYIDDRSLMGINVWLKPMKFCISTAIYVLSLGFLITLYPYSKRKKQIINGVVSWTLLVELGIIIIQAFRGVQSHYNLSSAIDAMAFAAMGILIGINVLIMCLFVFDTMRLKLKTEKSIQWAILLGWVMVIIGSWVGGQMISQMSHNVGIADGGAGLPFLNWSIIAGDLRVAHFFGLHALQILPLVALVLYRTVKTSMRNQVIAVTFFALLYGGWIGYTFYQAKQGMALLGI